jgi:hypothetical protein
MAIATSTAPQGGLHGRPSLPVTLLHAQQELPCLVKPCGAASGADHAALTELFELFGPDRRVASYGSWCVVLARAFGGGRGCAPPWTSPAA